MNWIDDLSDYPLSYMIAYYTLTDEQLTIVKPSNEGSSARSLLSQGLSSKLFLVTCIVFATDVLGDVGTYEKDVRVDPIPLADLSGVLDSQLSLAFKTLDADKVSSLVSAATATLNRVDCSRATQCVIFNRNSCSYSAQTCGPCLKGFKGVPGHANSGCFISYTHTLFPPFLLLISHSPFLILYF